MLMPLSVSYELANGNTHLGGESEHLSVVLKSMETLPDPLENDRPCLSKDLSEDSFGSWRVFIFFPGGWTLVATSQQLCVLCCTVVLN